MKLQICLTVYKKCIERLFETEFRKCSTKFLTATVHRSLRYYLTRFLFRSVVAITLSDRLPWLQRIYHPSLHFVAVVLLIWLKYRFSRSFVKYRMGPYLGSFPPRWVYPFEGEESALDLLTWSASTSDYSVDSWGRERADRDRSISWKGICGRFGNYSVSLFTVYSPCGCFTRVCTTSPAVTSLKSWYMRFRKSGSIDTIGSNITPLFLGWLLIHIVHSL